MDTNSRGRLCRYATFKFTQSSQLPDGSQGNVLCVGEHREISYRRLALKRGGRIGLWNWILASGVTAYFKLKWPFLPQTGGPACAEIVSLVITLIWFPRMKMDTIKLELIGWITHLNDDQSIQKLLTLKNELSKSTRKSESKIYGSGKDLIQFVAEDFNAPLDMFNDYEK